MTNRVGITPLDIIRAAVDQQNGGLPAFHYNPSTGTVEVANNELVLTAVAHALDRQEAQEARAAQDAELVRRTIRVTNIGADDDWAEQWPKLRSTE